MRPSQQKKINQYLQEQQDDNHFLAIQKSLHLNSRKPNQPRNHHHHKGDNNHNKNISRKYEQPGKQDFLSILDPLPKIQPREDFNIRSQPPPAHKQDPLSAKKNCLWTGKGRKGESPRKSMEELNMQIDEYKKQGERILKNQLNHKNSFNYSAKKIQKSIELSNIEEKDLSFAELKPEYNFKKDKDAQKNVDLEQEAEEEQDDESSDWLSQLDKSPQGQQADKRQSRQFKPEPPRVERIGKQEEKQKIERRGKQEQQQKQPEVLQESIVSIESNSNTKTINRAFNNLSKDSSSNNSSCWVEEKILESLNHSISNESDSISDNTESFISNIHQNAIVYSGAFPFAPSAPSKPVLSPEEEKARVDKILKQISTSQNFQIKEMNLQVKELKNIMEVTVKEVSVDRLGTSLKLALGEDGIMVKRSEVEVEKLRQYISFYQISVAYPRIFYSEPLSSTFPFCRLRVPPVQVEEQPKERGFIKKGKRKEEEEGIKAEELLRVVLVQLKCMSCQKASDVPVVKNQAYLSCRNCNQQMIANIQPTFST